MTTTIQDAVERFKDVFIGDMFEYYMNADSKILRHLMQNCEYDPDGVGWNCYFELSQYENKTGAPFRIEWSISRVEALSLL